MRLISFLTGCLFFGLPTSFAAQMWNDSTPVQVYQEAGEASDSDSATESSQAQAVTASPQPPAALTPAYNNPTPSPTVIETDVKDVDQAIVLLNQELTQLNRNAVLFEQTTNDKMEEVNRKLNFLRKQIQQIAQGFVILKKQLSGLENPPSESKTDLIKYLPWAIVGVLLLLLLLISLSNSRKLRRYSREKEETIKSAEEDDTQDEYDYLGSNESIPAKLNLARAYIAMDDYPAAGKIIDEVLQAGNEAQRKEADELKQQILKKKD